MDLQPSFAALETAIPQPSTPASAPGPRGASFKAILADLANRMDQGERSVNAVTQAAPRLGPGGELLALQAGVYRYTETFEVASKLVDKASSAIKTTLQGQ
jgi:hypothetical protein